MRETVIGVEHIAEGVGLQNRKERVGLGMAAPSLPCGCNLLNLYPRVRRCIPPSPNQRQQAYIWVPISTC